MLRSNQRIVAVITFAVICLGLTNALAADFEFNPLPTPASQTIVQGDTANYNIYLKSISGYNSAVTLSINNISPWPGGNNEITGTFSPNPVTPQDPAASSTLSVSSALSAIPGTYTIQIKATDGVITKYASVGLAINPSPLNGSISGSVREEESGNLLDGVVVHSKEEFDNWQDRGIGTTVGGLYKIEGLRPGTYSIYSKLPNYGTASEINIQVRAGEETQNHNLAMTNNPGWIYGTVTDGVSPLENVKVEVCVQGPNYSWIWIGACAYTNASGYYELRDLAARPNYIVQITGYTKGSVDYGREVKFDVNVAKGQGTALDFSLQPAVKISGKVTDSWNSPLKNVALSYQLIGTFIGSGNYLTDEQGNYAIGYLAPGYYEIQATPVSTTDYILQKTGINAASAGDYTLNFTLRRGAIKISGLVTDRDSSQPLPNIRMQYYNKYWTEAFTDIDGLYALTNLPRGSGELRAMPDSIYARDAIETDFPQDTVVNFALAPESTLSGVTRDFETAEPILSSLRVNYWHWSKPIGISAMSDSSNGTFTFKGLPEGIGEFTIRPPVETGLAWDIRYYYLAEGGHKTGVSLMAKQGALITGSVQDPNHNPIPGVYARASGSEGQEWWDRTDSNGAFKIRLAPGKYEIGLENDEDYAAIPQEISVASPTDDQSVNFTGYNCGNAGFIKGEALNYGQFPKEENSNFVVVAFEAGKLVNEDTLEYTDPIRMSALKEAGPYELMLAPGQAYDLYFGIFKEGKVYSFTGRGGLKSVPAGAVNQDFSYDSEGGKIWGRVTSNTIPLLLAKVYLKDSAGNLMGFAETDEDGAYHFYNVLAGNYIVNARHPYFGKSGSIAASGISNGSAKQVNIAIAPSFVKSIAPTFGSSLPDAAVEFTAVYSHLGGWQELKSAYLLMNATTGEKNCLSAYYNQNENKLYLRNNANTCWLGGFAPGSSKIIQNSYVKIDCLKTTVTGSGNDLIVKWNITPKLAFANIKTKNIYLKADDDYGVAVAWMQKGTWLIGANSTPAVATVLPSRGANRVIQPITFSTTYTDPNTWQDIKAAYFLINTSTANKNCFYGYYNQNTNKLYLRNDANTAWLGGFAPGSSKIIENSFAKLDCAQTTLITSGNCLKVKWNITFKDTFTGAKNTYLKVIDDSNASAGLTQKGTWTIRP